MFVPLDSAADAKRSLQGRFSPEEIKKYTNATVQACLVLGQNKNPIKKSELNSVAQLPRLSTGIIQIANKKLNKIFGMRLYELEDKARYLLVNTKPDFNSLFARSDAECVELAVLYFVLMDIFVNPDEKVSEEDLINTLKPLDYTDTEIQAYLEQFVKQLYLRQEKRTDAKLFAWGPRAVAEIEPDNFFSRFLELVGDSSDKDWPDLKKRADKLKSVAGR